jgi:hypothetical protein
VIAIATTSNPRFLYVYEQHRNEVGEVEQSAWSTWTFNNAFAIRSVSVFANTMQVVGLIGGAIYSVSINLYTDLYSVAQTHFLDFKTANTLYSNDGITFLRTPEEPYIAGMVAVGSSGTNFNEQVVPTSYTINGGNDIVFSASISGGAACTISFGTLFTSSYKPTRPHLKTEDGVAILSDSLRIARHKVYVHKTPEITQVIDSDYYPQETITYEHKPVGTFIPNTVAFLTGEVDFPFDHLADEASVTFRTSGPLNMIISGINWLGQYHKQSRRLK